MQVEEANAWFAYDGGQYYMHEGSKDGLKNLTQQNVPSIVLEELEDDDHEFDNITSLEMMENLKANCIEVDC